MKNLCFALGIASFLFVSSSYGSEVGMPQLNPEFWTSQIFWLILVFSILYFVIWKVFLPKITYSIENRKSRVVNDLDEAEKLKESAKKKLEEYNQIIENSKKESKKIIDDGAKKLNRDIQNKKQEVDIEIEKELVLVEKEIKELKKSSLSNINRIAVETSSEIVQQIIGAEVNKSNVSAIVNDILKKNSGKYI